MVFIRASMPTVTPQQGDGQGSRTSFRPPWVKDPAPSLPLAQPAPWMRSREQRVSRDEGAPRPREQRVSRDEGVPRPREQRVSRDEGQPKSREQRLSRDDGQPSAISRELTEARERLSAVEGTTKPPIESLPAPPRKLSSKIMIFPSRPSAEPVENGQQVKSVRSSSINQGPKEKRISNDVPQEKKPPVEREKTIPIVITTEAAQPPPPPPAPAGPPMPPPPPSMPGKKERPVSKLKIEKIESLRSRPRKRPDWGTMMKEIESGRKLNHVVCNDRSAPLIATPIKVKEQFLYESEKPNVHNRLLEQIQQGVPLKRVKTNDRSKPILDGLRKFRRQMTIEEQTQKEAEAAIAEPDELDDIDKVRDDLQSTKQMLALELRNKEALERENKRLQARVLNLEVEIEKEKASRLKEESPQERRIQEEEENRKLKTELQKAQQLAEDMENKYHDTVGQLEMTRGELEDLQRKNHILERRMSNYASRDGDQPLYKQPSAKKLNKSSSGVGKQAARAQNEKEEESEEEEESEYEEETDSEEESSEEDEAAVQERRTARELKLLSTKIKSFKDKEEAVRKERVVLKDQLKKLTATLKEEKKRYKEIQKEVESMASVLKEDEEEVEEEEEEEETESESESESEASEEESEGDLPPDAPVEERKKNLTNRSKKHENCLAVLKKGNYMLKANVDRVKDDLFKQKEMAISLQEDLNAVLAELG